jgi:hypothetical protein
MKVSLEPAAQEFVDATADPPFLYELPPEEGRRAVDGVQDAEIFKPDVDEKWIVVDAVRLARATLASASKGQALVFGESLIGSLVAGNPELAEETETVLDPILQLKSEDETRVLLLTLRAWFEAGGSYERVASGMYVHRNTVRNRIRRLETLTDRSLVDPRQSAEILVALTALDQRANEQTSR